ncbi:PAS-domain containing protein [Terasakiella sp. A23]|uniref:PAS-domain containing protein n=1 Tax=Terasakiella sp. FCG-A23 TaxID=3080561 RepID=UPI0029549451|nr:PAS-domain containing protein [Terasakiella sp. A23]MDV7339640.1 PAS-domain containing protein [Terasakiella sp. A23]
MGNAHKRHKNQASNLLDGPSLDAQQWAFVQTGLEHLDDGFSIFDADLNLVAWNSKFFELTDFPIEEFGYYGSPFEGFIRYNAERGEYGQFPVEDIIADTVAEAKKFLPHVMERERPNGTILEIQGNPMPGGGFVTIYKDITQRKQAEIALRNANDELEARVQKRTAELKNALDALKESEERIRLIADTVPALIGYVNAKEGYTFANKQYKDWFGRDPEQIVGGNPRDILGEKTYHELKPCIAAALNGEQTSREFMMQLANGREVHALVSYVPHVNEQKEVIGYFVLGQDVTDVRDAEFKFRQAQKMEAIGQLTGGLSHDFNNLLTIIIGNLSVLQEEGEEDPTLLEMVDPALDAARRGGELVKQLLAFARRQPLKPRISDAGELILGMKDLLGRALGAQVEMQLKVNQNIWPVLIDPHQLENAILNLVINARDAMNGVGLLKIYAENVTLKNVFSDRNVDLTPGDYVVISVKDTGTGMSTEIMERIFEPFFSTKEKGPNSGLGLSMIYGFVRQSQGHIQVDSTPSEGTTFRIVLPRSSEVAKTEPQPKRNTNLPQGTERILLVEDDPGVRGFAANSLQRLGYEIIAVCDGHEALGILEMDQDFDLVFSDIEMPGGLNGIHMAEQIREKLPDMPVLFMSGYPDKVMDQTGIFQGQLDLIAKPFERLELANRVRNALDRNP